MFFIPKKHVKQQNGVLNMVVKNSFEKKKAKKP